MNVLRSLVPGREMRAALAWTALNGGGAGVAALISSQWSDADWQTVVVWVVIASFFSYRIGRFDEKEVGAPRFGYVVDVSALALLPKVDVAISGCLDCASLTDVRVAGLSGGEVVTGRCAACGRAFAVRGGATGEVQP